MSANFLSVKSPTLLSKYFGDTEAAIRSIFRSAHSVAPCVVFFDDFDCLAVQRSADSDGTMGLQGRVLSTLLNELDGIAESRRTEGSRNEVSGDDSRAITVIVACERKDLIDDALLRPG